jgi:hypothetical protein
MIGLGLILAAVCGVVAVVRAADAVEPASATVVCLRDEGVAYINATEYYRGTTILFTNCILYAGTTTASARQGLDAVTIECKWGVSGTNHTFAGTVQSATGGLWWASFNAPTNWESPFLQVKITDSLTNNYIYPWKMIHTKSSL